MIVNVNHFLIRYNFAEMRKKSFTSHNNQQVSTIIKIFQISRSHEFAKIKSSQSSLNIFKFE
jgi:hypothetical protein